MSRSVLRGSYLLIFASWVMVQAGCYDAAPADESTAQLAVEILPASGVLPVDEVQVASELEPPEETPQAPLQPVEKVATAELVSEPIHKSTPQVRNVILIIGDGMGPQQLGLLFAYAHLAPGSNIPDRTPAIEQMVDHGSVALVRTEPYGAIVVDSASAATQLATGEYAGSEMIGVDYLGQSVPTVLEIAKQEGKSTGLISDTRITHATPAAFAAHQPHRSMENEIASDILANRVDVLLSGGLRHWIPESVNDKKSASYLAVVQMIGGQFEPSSKRQDNRNLLVEARQDYHLVFDRTALAGVKDGRVLGLFANSEMYDAIGERDALDREDRTQPTLVEMTDKALELLSQNPRGFFLMIEGGQIDWAAHNNDTGTMLHELLQLDDAVRSVLEWARDRDDTVVLVTADHETGSFGFSYSGTPQPEPKTLPGNVFQGAAFQPDFNFGAPELLDQLHDQKRSYFDVFSEFDSLSQREQTAENLMEMINDAVAPFSITLEDATKILTRTANPQYIEGHHFLGTKTVPKMPDPEEFYVYGENARMNRLARILSAQQGTVWGTGTHTNTPVVLVTIGPESATKRFTGLIHSTDVGKRMIDLVRGE